MPRKSVYGAVYDNLTIYTDEQEAWLKEIEKFRNRNRRYPTLQEAFRIAVAMGYRKVARNG